MNDGIENGLIVGYDLCADHCRISYHTDDNEEPKDLVFSDEENPYLIRNAICKKKGEDSWIVGQEAYETALLGGGSIVDKLLRLTEHSGFASFEGVRYSAEELLQRFLQETLKVLYKESGKKTIREITFTVQVLSGTVLDALIRAMKAIGIERKRVHIVSHTESWLYFILSRSRELRSNVAVLFDLSGDGLNYYEMNLLRGMQPNIAHAERTFLEEGFSLDILDSQAGCRMADSIMTSCVDRMLKKKLVSSAYLSGSGMDHCQRWGSGFLKTLCERRRVFFVENLFAKGAVYAALDRMRETSAYPYRIMCEGRISVDISMDVVKGVRERTLMISEIGQNWYECKTSFDIIPDQAETLKLKVKKLGEKAPVDLEIPLHEFTKRGSKLTRIGVSVEFHSEDNFSVVLKDKGFGEFFPAGDTVVRRNFNVG